MMADHSISLACWCNRNEKLISYRKLQISKFENVKFAMRSHAHAALRLITHTNMSKRKLEAAQFVHKKHKGSAGEDTDNNGLQGQKQRTLMFANRGISGHGRHLMNDLRLLVPCKKESKMDLKGELYVINEMCEVAACNNCVFFEQRGNDLFMWVSKAPNGPSVKFLVLNSMYSPHFSYLQSYYSKSSHIALPSSTIHFHCTSNYMIIVHTMDELKMTGNCLRGSRPFISFDKSFDEHDHTRVIKQMFTQVCSICSLFYVIWFFCFGFFFCCYFFDYSFVSRDITGILHTKRHFKEQTFHWSCFFILLPRWQDMV